MFNKIMPNMEYLLSFLLLLEKSLRFYQYLMFKGIVFLKLITVPGERITWVALFLWAGVS